MVTQQYEKAKAIQEEQLERLTQICQEQGVTFSDLPIPVQALLRTLESQDARA